MESIQLRIFLETAAQGNITRAAAKLHLTQPAVTKQIHSLEESIGTRLFDRVPRGVQLTPSGEVLRDYAVRSSSLLQEGLQKILEMEKGEAGRITIGAGVTTCMFQLPAWLRTLREEYPKLDFVVRTGASSDVLKMTLEREVDAGFVTSQIQDPLLSRIPLFKEAIVVVAPPGYLKSDRVIKPRQLGTLPMMLFPPSTGFRRDVEAQLAKAGVGCSVRMETDSVEAIKSFVAAGLGISFLPMTAVKEEIDRGKMVLVRCAGLKLSRTTSLIRLKERYLTRGVRRLMEIASVK